MSTEIYHKELMSIINRSLPKDCVIYTIDCYPNQESRDKKKPVIYYFLVTNSWEIKNFSEEEFNFRELFTYSVSSSFREGILQRNFRKKLYKILCSIKEKRLLTEKISG